MKKKMIFTGLFGVLLIFGLFVAGCDTGSGSGTTTTTNTDGTNPGGNTFTGGYTPQNLNNTVWKGGGYTLTFTSTTTYMSEETGGDKWPGTYTVTGNRITFKNDDGPSFIGTFSGNTLVANGTTFVFDRRRS
ncbi:hypothetical protein LQZ21_07140 [Treponema sp. TIM-1]|uniref:hypothetical protein n=1 Tax=Treponema sp. TIM-1 TaxID=2898417 RepID=UPI00397EC5D3